MCTRESTIDKHVNLFQTFHDEYIIVCMMMMSFFLYICYIGLNES